MELGVWFCLLYASVTSFKLSVRLSALFPTAFSFDVASVSLIDTEVYISESFKELQLNSSEELKEGKVEVDAAADLKLGSWRELHI